MTNGCCAIKITLNNTNKKGDEQRENKIYKKIERTIVECFCYLFIDMRFLFILACCTSVEYLRLMRFFIETRVDNKKKEKKMNFILNSQLKIKNAFQTKSAIIFKCHFRFIHIFRVEFVEKWN